MRTRHSITTSAILLLTANAHASDPDCGSSSYTGFALKSNSSCKSYVYCQSGVVSSTTNCPDGLLFNGGVGQGGICTWPDAVSCESDAATTAVVTSAATTVATTSKTIAAGSMAAGTASASSEGDLPSPWQQYLDSQSGNYYYHNPDTDVTQWERPIASSNAVPPPPNSASLSGNASADNANTSSNTVTNQANTNPNNYYCGQSHEDAASKCFPCPSGSLLDCEDVTHGCFRDVNSCSEGASNSGSKIGTATTEAPRTTLSASLNDFLDGLTGNVPSPSIIHRPTENMPTVDGEVMRPTVNSDMLEMHPVNNIGEEEKPTYSPTLPPWTNAPFASYRGPRRDKIVIGYYASWQWYDRNKFADPKNVDFSKYDRINYAFFQPDKEGNIYGTDEWADPQLLWGEYDYAPQATVKSGPNRNYFCSWDGPSLSQHNCATHKGDGIIARAKAVGTQVMPSIGGWTLSDNFPTIAATEEGRRTFATNCVKLIEEYDFDGIDIDWEYPAYEDHSGTPADTVNYTYFLQAIRDALDKLGQAKGRYFPLTAALPCGPDKIEKIQVDKIKHILDEFNLMSYDLHGAWDVLTGINAPMFDQGWTDQSKRWSVHGCTEAYRDYGVPLEMMNLGLPFYGRSFRKATGMKQIHEGADDINFHLDEGSPQYYNIVKTLGRMTTYRHEKTQTQYAVFKDTGGLVSYDDARAICDKVHYANQRGMHGFLVWEISGDMLDNGETPLIDATNNKINNPSFDCSKLRDPIWALSDATYHYAPPEPETVDWSAVPHNLAAPMGYSNGDTVPIPAPTPISPAPPTTANNNIPTLNSNVVGIQNINNNLPPTTSSSLSDDCPPDHTGYWASSDCTHYMYCQAGAIVGALMPCVPGTLFDVTTATCAFAANVPSCSR